MFYSVLEFLVSPMGLPIFFLIVFVLPLSFYAHKKGRRFSVLREHFRGHYSWISGLAIDFSGHKFHFSEQGRSRGSVDYGGIATRPMLWGYIESTATFLCANPDTTKYEFNWNLGNCPHRKTVAIAGGELLIGSDSEVFLEKLEKNLLGDVVLAQELRIILEEAGAYLVGKTETLVGHKSAVANEKVFRYFGFKETVYSDPAILEHRMKTILDIFERQGIVLEQSKR